MQKYEFLDPGCFITTIFKILSILEFEFSQGPVSKNLIGRRVIYLLSDLHKPAKIKDTHSFICARQPCVGQMVVFFYVGFFHCYLICELVYFLNQLNFDKTVPIIAEY